MQKREAGNGKEGKAEQSQKKSKTGNEDKIDNEIKEKVENENRKSSQEIKAEFEKFCKATSEHLTIMQMREILEANDQDANVSDDAVVPRCQDVLFYGQLDKCPICGGTLEVLSTTYSCKGAYNEWSSCSFTTKVPPRLEEHIKLPDSVMDSGVAPLLNKYQKCKSPQPQLLNSIDKPFQGMLISLAGRLSRSHQYWKSKIEKNGGKVANSVMGVTCLVVSPSERGRVALSKVVEAMDREIPIASEAWLIDSIEKREAQPLDAYNDLTVAGRGIPLYQQEGITAELKIYGKRSVHKDTKLQNVGAQIFERDGILYNSAFALSDRWRGVNDFCIIQLITIPENGLYMYYKRGRIGDEGGSNEKLDEWENTDNAIKEFALQFQALTGNEFERWEREKKIQKKLQKFFPIDMDDGMDVRHGGLGLRQLGIAVAHCKLDPKVANFMKVLCCQEIYRYAMMEIGSDVPELPLGMVTDVHLKRCEKMLLEMVEKLKTNKETGPKRDALWSDVSQRIFTLLPSTRPYVFQDFGDIGDHGAAAFEMVRDINMASRLIGDMSGPTLDDPLFDRYKKLGCSISPVDKDTDEYKMVAKYLEKTYEPVKIGEISYGVSIDDVFSVEQRTGPSFDEVKKLPNKVLLWCGTRSSNLLRHLHKGLLPAVCSIPVPGYMFGKAIVCSDAAAEAAQYGFTVVDRPEGFLLLAVASLGDNVTEFSNAPEDTTRLEEKKRGVIGLGRKKTDESEHFIWKDDIKVPCGKLIPSEHKDSPLEYNEYAVYDPQQVDIKFLVAVKFEEKDVEYDTAEP